MVKQHMVVPPSVKNEDIELVASKLVMWGYEVKLKKYTSGEYKGIKIIDFTREEGKDGTL